MTYSQPDPAEETTADVVPEQPDTDTDENEEHSDAETATDVKTDDVPTSGDGADDAEP